MNSNLLIKLPTPIDYYGEVNYNQLYIKRDDLTDVSFGGNKARKIQYFLKDAISQNADCIVTYGSIQSNHCRITSAVATANNMEVYLIQPESNENASFNGNALLNSFFEPKIISTPLTSVAATIDRVINELKLSGKSPYFIEGGGHGDLGTHAYKVAYDEIINQEEKLNLEFDYVFHASGTGTTQAGLIAGKLIKNKTTEIVGISVARKNEHGSKVIKESLLSYLKDSNLSIIEDEKIQFIDNYIGDGYGDVYPEIIHTIKDVAKKSTIFLDPIYTGKAFYGMQQYIEQNKFKNKKILFIHTGGTPILFNYAEQFKRSLDYEHFSN